MGGSVLRLHYLNWLYILFACLPTAFCWGSPCFPSLSAWGLVPSCSDTSHPTRGTNNAVVVMAPSWSSQRREPPKAKISKVSKINFDITEVSPRRRSGPANRHLFLIWPIFGMSCLKYLSNDSRIAAGCLGFKSILKTELYILTFHILAFEANFR